jgi:hypothetical protein
LFQFKEAMNNPTSKTRKIASDISGGIRMRERTIPKKPKQETQPKTSQPNHQAATLVARIEDNSQKMKQGNQLKDTPAGLLP